MGHGESKGRAISSWVRPASLCLPGSFPAVPVLPTRDPEAHLYPEPQNLSLSPRRRRTPKRR